MPIEEEEFVKTVFAQPEESKFELWCQTCETPVIVPAHSVHYLYDTYAHDSSYTFYCGDCGRIQVNDANSVLIISRLVQGGCKIEEWSSFTDEILDRQPANPVFTVDDELDFHKILQESETEWFEALKACTDL